MSFTLDLVIRGGTILDGLGGDPFVADLGIAVLRRLRTLEEESRKR